MFDSKVSTGNINIHLHGFCLDKIMEALHIVYAILYEHGVEPPFAFNTAALLLGIDLYKF
jgi:hypothetical protein